MPRARSNGIELEYETFGSRERPAILLIMGLGVPRFGWDEAFCRLLADRGFSVVRFDNRDVGLSTKLDHLPLPNRLAILLGRFRPPYTLDDLADDAAGLLDALGIEKAIAAGFDWGARTAVILAALWPERCSGLVSVSGYLIGSQAAGQVPLPPKAELQWWYQFYFATERGRAGYERYRREFARLIWRIASPRWTFDDPTFDRSAASFDNPDHVDIVIHNYRWRLGLAQGEPRYDEVETRLAAAPAISVPTITLEGDANGAPHPDASAYAHKFSGRYEHRVIAGGIGHNLPQEAPEAFAQAIFDVDAL